MLNTFWDCRAHFFRQHFSRQIYVCFIHPYAFLVVLFFPISSSFPEPASPSSAVGKGNGSGRFKNRNQDFLVPVWFCACVGNFDQSCPSFWWVFSSAQRSRFLAQTRRIVAAGDEIVFFQTFCAKRI